MREIRRLGKRRSGVGSCGWAYGSGHTVWGLWYFMLTLTREHPQQKGHKTALWTHAYYFVHCPHVTCPNWNMLLVKILDFKDLGVQKKRTIKCFLLLLWLHIEIFLILGWIKIFWIVFFLLFSMQLLENVKLYVQLTPMTHIMLM